MESLIYINCFNPESRILNALPYLGFIYLFLTFIQVPFIPTMIYTYIFLNGVFNILIPCYYTYKINRQPVNMVILNRNRVLNTDFTTHSVQINGWKTSVSYVSQDFFCTICYNDNNRKAIFNNCEHSICYDCINGIHKNECPFCREPIVNI